MANLFVVAIEAGFSELIKIGNSLQSFQGRHLRHVFTYLHLNKGKGGLWGIMYVDPWKLLYYPAMMV